MEPSRSRIPNPKAAKERRFYGAKWDMDEYFSEEPSQDGSKAPLGQTAASGTVGASRITPCLCISICIYGVWYHSLNVAIVSDTSSIPQHDLDNYYFGPCRGYLAGKCSASLSGTLQPWWLLRCTASTSPCCTAAPWLLCESEIQSEGLKALGQGQKLR